MSNNHNVFVFETQTGTQKWSSPGDTADILDVAWHGVVGTNKFCTVGAKHIKFWTADSGAGEKGLFG